MAPPMVGQATKPRTLFITIQHPRPIHTQFEYAAMDLLCQPWPAMSILSHLNGMVLGRYAQTILPCLFD